MFKLLGWIVKAAFISVVILVLGNTLEYHGKTLSDQVRSSLSHAESSNAVDGMKTWTHEISSNISERTHKDALEAKRKLLKKIAAQKKIIAAHTASAQQKAKQLLAESQAAIQRKVASQTTATETPQNAPSEDIQASERQELRNLIRQLNDSTEKLSTN
jgi:hypothetical protein